MEASFLWVMEMLKNADDLGLSKMFLSTASPPKFYPIWLYHACVIAIPGLLLLLIAASADELPVIKDSEAVQYVGKSRRRARSGCLCHRKPLGTAYISFGREYP